MFQIYMEAYAITSGGYEKLTAITSYGGGYLSQQNARQEKARI
jgi:hypothetical protein